MGGEEEVGEEEVVGEEEGEPDEEGEGVAGDGDPPCPRRRAGDGDEEVEGLVVEEQGDGDVAERQNRQDQSLHSSKVSSEGGEAEGSGRTW